MVELLKAGWTSNYEEVTARVGVLKYPEVVHGRLHLTIDQIVLSLGLINDPCRS